MSKGFSPIDFSKEDVLQKLDEEETMYHIITSFSAPEKEKYSSLFAHLKKLHIKGAEATNKEKGDALEDLVTFLLKSSAIFDVYENVHTSSNELDQLVRLNTKGHRFKNKGYIKFKEDILLSECKNYQKPVSVSWVGKFSSLMTYVDTKIGLLFSYYGLSGKGWNDAIGLTKKLYLGSEENKKIFILPFDKSDFQKIEQGDNLLNLIDAKMFALRTDTNFLKYVKPHPGEKESPAVE